MPSSAIATAGCVGSNGHAHPGGNGTGEGPAAVVGAVVVVPTGGGDAAFFRGPQAATDITNATPIEAPTTAHPRLVLPMCAPLCSFDVLHDRAIRQPTRARRASRIFAEGRRSERPLT
jgi:hypothetical protein